MDSRELTNIEIYKVRELCQILLKMYDPSKDNFKNMDLEEIRNDFKKFTVQNLPLNIYDECSNQIDAIVLIYSGQISTK